MDTSTVVTASRLALEQLSSAGWQIAGRDALLIA